MQKTLLVQKSVVAITFMALLCGLGVTIAQAQTAAPKLVVKKGKDLRLEDTFTAANGGRWVEVHKSDYSLYLADETSIKTIGPDLREVVVMAGGRGDLDVSVSRQVFNCRTGESREVAAALINANGRSGEWLPVQSSMRAIPYIYKHTIPVFFHACFSTQDLMDVARTFPEAVTYLRSNTPKP